MGSIDFYCSVDIESVSEAFQSAVDGKKMIFK